MYFRIGATPFDPNSVSVTRSSVARLNRAGNPIARLWAWSVTVYLGSAATTPAARQVDFVVQEARLHNLLDVPGQEYALHCDNGTPAMVLSPVGAVAPPKAVEVGNLVEGRGEYAGKRTISFKVTAEYPLTGNKGLLLNFEETLSFVGDGGPIWDDYGADSGYSIRQVIRPNSKCFAYQQGTATGYLAYPNFGGPHGSPISLWPADYKSNLSRYDVVTPRVTGETYTDFTITWAYSHERWGTPFVGVPHLWK
ncbi:hypothetical protein [Limnoglobus roseus]|uniref:Uncharacterized protein n=1 Tax=Limnoglobus roseus TaxID=2598579 RepID=A0A5C1AJX3_9BACT|nr:hypothetical protein [Limnoglobus roseus]QEL18316.1 hypothetical protein PX52LOC_05337 [Limnoglobus roseus]